MQADPVEEINNEAAHREREGRLQNNLLLQVVGTLTQTLNLDLPESR